MALNLRVISRGPITCETTMSREGHVDARSRKRHYRPGRSISTSRGSVSMASGCAESNGRLIFVTFYFSSCARPRARNRLVTLRLYNRAVTSVTLELHRNLTSPHRTHTIRSDRYLQSAVDTSFGNVHSRACRPTVPRGNKNPAW